MTLGRRGQTVKPDLLFREAGFSLKYYAKQDLLPLPLHPTTGRFPKLPEFPYMISKAQLGTVVKVNLEEGNSGRRALLCTLYLVLCNKSVRILWG